MKIGNAADKPLVSPTVTSTGTPAGQKGPAPVAGVGATAPAGTQVELSPAAAALRAQEGSEVFDAEKVARISSAISEGRFQVNPGVIADKLIANARELLDRSQK